MHETKLEALEVWLIRRRHTTERLRSVDAADLSRASEPAGETAGRLSGLGFRYVTLDLQGFRSGSMNEVLLESRLRVRS